MRWPSGAPASSALSRVGLACVALLCAVPFLQPYHRFPLTAFFSEWLAFALGLGVMVPLLERRSWQAAGVPMLALAPFALAALLIAHGVLGWSPYFGHALTAALYLIWAGALVIAARSLAHAYGPETVYAVIAAGLASGGLLSALIGVVQHFNVITPFNAFIARPTSAAIFGNLAQPNHFAMQVTLGLLSLAYLYARGRVPVVMGVGAAALMLFVLGLSGSRAALLYLFAAFALAAWLRAGAKDRAARRLFILTGVFVIAYYVLQLLVDAGWFKAEHRVAVTAVERLFSGAGSISERFSLWRAAWAMTLDHPLVGVGWGSFSGHYFNFVTETDATGLYPMYNHSHNIVLQLLAETGVPGAILVVVPLIAWVYYVLAGGRGVGWWWLLALAAVIGIHSLLEYPLWYAYFLAPVALLLGVAPGKVFTLRLARAGPTLALAVIAIGAVNLITLGLDYRDFDRVFHSRPGQLSNDEFAATMRELHRNPVLTPYIEIATALLSSPDRADLDRRRLLNERTLRFVPMTTLVYREVLLLALADRPKEALALLTRARRAYPAVPRDFQRDLVRLAREQPALMRPLIESVFPAANR